MREDIYQDCLSEKISGKTRFWPELYQKYCHIYPSAEAIRSAFKKESKKRGVPPAASEAQSTYQETDRVINIVYANTPLKTKEDVIKEYKIDMTKWKVDFFEVRPSQGYRKDRKVKWKVEDGKVIDGEVDDSGKMLVVQLYSLRIKFVPITTQTITLESIREYYQKTNKVNKASFPRYKPSNKRILDINTADWHLGARFYNKNWSDVEDAFPAMFSDILNRINNCKGIFTKIYFNLLGDVAHYQNRQQKTERNMQTVEGNGMNPLEIFDIASSMCISAIDQLLQIAPVEMLYIPGNHDGDLLYYLLARMKSHFYDVGTFSVDLEHASRKVRMFGANLRGWEHGEMPKKNKIHWLASEHAPLWGKSQYRETFAGHWHHEEVIEHGGVKTRILPAVAPKDFWHHRNGYNGNIRATMSFVWEEDRLGWADIWQSAWR